MVANATVASEDVLSVRSRISWGAILAGAVLALSLYFLLTLLGGAIVFSISDHVNSQGLNTGAGIYAVIVTAICLFIGGYVASQLTAGENALEGSLYGIFVWATVFAALLFLTATSARVGFSALSAAATAGSAVADNASQVGWEASARQAGVPQEQIDQWKQRAKDAPATVKQAAEDPANQKAAADAAMKATWYAFFGVWVSMMAGAAGGYLGSGPRVRLLATSSTADPAAARMAATRV